MKYSDLSQHCHVSPAPVFLRKTSRRYFFCFFLSPYHILLQLYFRESRQISLHAQNLLFDQQQHTYQSLLHGSHRNPRQCKTGARRQSFEGTVARHSARSLMQSFFVFY